MADEQGIEAAGTIVMQGDAVILAARFADPAAAGVAYERVRDAEVNQELNIDGVLVADADADGKIDVAASSRTTTPAAARSGGSSAAPRWP